MALSTMFPTSAAHNGDDNGNIENKSYSECSQHFLVPIWFYEKFRKKLLTKINEKLSRKKEKTR